MAVWGSAGPSSRHCCPTAQLTWGEPSFTQECGAHQSKKQVSHICSVSFWTWLVMDSPDLVGGATLL